MPLHKNQNKLLFPLFQLIILSVCVFGALARPQNDLDQFNADLGDDLGGTFDVRLLLPLGAFH